MKTSTRAVNWVLRRVFETVCRIDRSEIHKIPARGPLILVANHIHLVEVPVFLPQLDPRDVIGLAKRESWKNPLYNFLFNQWEAIPIDRGVVDREAFRRMLDVLEQGKILAVYPEGTRSRDGRLLQGKAGIVALAQKSGAPMLPIGFHGYENFSSNLKRLCRTDFHIKIGKPFKLNSGAEALLRGSRQEVTDEIMCKIAELLPERYRGYYEGACTGTYQYLVDA
jgi:1-acyl-sn-glycerol-3-phosphate acyltransferase